MLRAIYLAPAMVVAGFIVILAACFTETSGHNGLLLVGLALVVAGVVWGVWRLKRQSPY